jgi:hypothetical protein
MATGDLAQFQTAATAHAKLLKKVITEAKELRSYWDKLGLPGAENAAAPLSNADLTNYATLCSMLQDFSDSVAVAAADRRGVIERLATNPISLQTKIS